MIDPKTAEEWKAQADRLLRGMAAGHVPIPATAVERAVRLAHRECCRRVLALLAEREEMQRQIEVEARSAAEYRRLAVAYENENGMRNHRAIRAEAEVERLLSMLREVECSGAPTCVGECCPICGGSVEAYWPTPDSYVQHRVLHEPDCRLAAALKGTP